MPKKSGRISAREFSSRFTEVVSRYLSALPPAEQDKRIMDAERAAMVTSRVEAPQLAELKKLDRSFFCPVPAFRS
jgi:hypothetical protein